MTGDIRIRSEGRGCDQARMRGTVYNEEIHHKRTSPANDDHTCPLQHHYPYSLCTAEGEGCCVAEGWLRWWRSGTVQSRDMDWGSRNGENWIDGVEVRILVLRRVPVMVRI